MPYSRRHLIGLIDALPTRAISRAVGWVARRRVPTALRAPFWRLIARQLGADLGEVDAPLHRFATPDAFFTRTLSTGARPIADGEGVLVSPADGVLTGVSTIERVLVKGREATLREWLGRDELPWKSPEAAVIYLSPRDYHRVHTPVGGQVVGVTYIPGSLIPVNPLVAGDGSLVFGRNERVTIWLESDNGPVAVTMVGAMGVGSMTLSFLDLVTNTAAPSCDLRFANEAIPVGRGDELGTFHLGSTVIVTWEGQNFRAGTDLCGDPRAIQMGRSLGAWLESKALE